MASISFNEMLKKGMLEATCTRCESCIEMKALSIVEIRIKERAIQMHIIKLLLGRLESTPSSFFYKGCFLECCLSKKKAFTYLTKG